MCARVAGGACGCSREDLVDQFFRPMDARALAKQRVLPLVARAHINLIRAAHVCVCVVRCACCVCVVRACARAVCALHANRTNVDNTSVCNRVCIRAVTRREGARPEVLSYGAEQLGVFPVCVDDCLRPPRPYRPRHPLPHPTITDALKTTYI